MASKLSYWALLAYALLILGSMATMSIGVAIVFASVLAGVGVAEFRELGKSREIRAYLAISISLVLACAITLVFAKLSPPGYNGEIQEFEFFPTIAKSWYLFLPLILLVALRRLDENQRIRVIQTWIAAFAVFSAIGVIQHFTGWPRPQVIPETPTRFHATLFIGHHLSVASILIFPFFVCLDFAANARNWARIPRGLAAGAALLGFFTLMLTYSRTLWVSLPIGIVVWALLSLPRKLKLIAVGAFAVCGAVATQLPAIQVRLQSAIGVGPRQELWRANWEFFKRWPLVGSGWNQNSGLAGMYLREKFPGQEIFGGHAHNNLLHMLGGTGLLGTLPWIAWSFLVVALVYRYRERIPFARGLLCAWLVFHLNGLTQVNFWEGKVLHQMMWVVGWTFYFVSFTRSEREISA